MQRYNVIALLIKNKGTNKDIVGMRVCEGINGPIADITTKEFDSRIRNSKGIASNVYVDAEYNIKGINGSIDRLVKIDIDTMEVINGLDKLPLIILCSIEKIGYRVCDYKGNIINVRNDDLIDYGERWGLCNGKIVTKGGKRYISAINGTFDITTLNTIKYIGVSTAEYVNELAKNNIKGDVYRDNDNRLMARLPFISSNPVCNIPEGLQGVQRSYKNTVGYKTLIMPDTLEFVGEQAFIGALELNYLYLGENIKLVERGAIPKQLIIVCKEGTYIHKYAKRNRYNIILVKSKSEVLDKIMKYELELKDKDDFDNYINSDDCFNKDNRDRAIAKAKMLFSDMGISDSVLEQCADNMQHVAKLIAYIKRAPIDVPLYDGDLGFTGTCNIDIGNNIAHMLGMSDVNVGLYKKPTIAFANLLHFYANRYGSIEDIVGENAISNYGLFWENISLSRIYTDGYNRVLGITFKNKGEKSDIILFITGLTIRYVGCTDEIEPRMLGRVLNSKYKGTLSSFIDKGDYLYYKHKGRRVPVKIASEIFVLREMLNQWLKLKYKENKEYSEYTYFDIMSCRIISIKSYRDYMLKNGELDDIVRQEYKDARTFIVDHVDNIENLNESKWGSRVSTKKLKGLNELFALCNQELRGSYDKSEYMCDSTIDFELMKIIKERKHWKLNSVQLDEVDLLSDCYCCSEKSKKWFESNNNCRLLKLSEYAIGDGIVVGEYKPRVSISKPKHKATPRAIYVNAIYHNGTLYKVVVSSGRLTEIWGTFASSAASLEDAHDAIVYDKDKLQTYNNNIYTNMYYKSSFLPVWRSKGVVTYTIDQHSALAARIHIAISLKDGKVYLVGELFAGKMQGRSGIHRFSEYGHKYTPILKLKNLKESIELVKDISKDELFNMACDIYTLLFNVREGTNNELNKILDIIINNSNTNNKFDNSLEYSKLYKLAVKKERV